MSTKLSDHKLHAAVKSRGIDPGFVQPPEEKVRKKQRNIESRMQQAVIKWWSTACAGFRLQEFALFAIPNGGKRGVITASIMKREGVRPGTADLFLMSQGQGYSGLFIEMKTPEGVQSEEQIKFQCAANFKGYRYSVCRSAAEAIEAITVYLS